MQMTSAIINDNLYTVEELLGLPKDNFDSLLYVDEAIKRQRYKIAAYQTARNAYANSLKSLLPKPKAKRGRKAKVKD